ncbi:hypothetical protein MHYP_G00310340 [Metynnis hypsauchen]
MAMEVIGAIDDFPCEAYDRQLVLLLCEDGNIYAYEDEVLHLIARSLRELLESGMTFPGIKLFNLGECFEDYTEEECEKIMECDEVKKMREEHTKFRESLELQLLESLLKLQNRQTEKELEEGEVWSRKTSDSSTTTKQDCWDLALRPPMPVVRWTKSDAVSIYSRSHTYQNHSHSNCKVACTASNRKRAETTAAVNVSSRAHTDSIGPEVTYMLSQRL